MPMSKKKREHKVSGGTGVGSRKVRLTELQKALMGGGAMARITIPAPNKPLKRDTE